MIIQRHTYIRSDAPSIKAFVAVNGKEVDLQDFDGVWSLDEIASLAEMLRLAYAEAKLQDELNLLLLTASEPDEEVEQDGQSSDQEGT